jgi:hypothetical protein
MRRVLLTIGVIVGLSAGFAQYVQSQLIFPRLL